MNLLEKLNQRFRPPRLTPLRIILALAVAVATDALQLPLGVTPFDPFIDLVAFGLTIWAIGFHVLLLPTFIAELFPVVDLLPTWTACVLAVIALRKREQNAVLPPPRKDGQE